MTHVVPPLVTSRLFTVHGVNKTLFRRGRRSSLVANQLDGSHACEYKVYGESQYLNVDYSQRMPCVETKFG